MDRFKKLKKEKSGKKLPKEKQPIFITDVKNFKENIKIKEILRSVKMNSSMRLKMPSGSTIMNNKDLNDESCFEESTVNQNSDNVLSATNPDVVVSNAETVKNEINIGNNSQKCTQECDNGNGTNDVAQENKHICDEIAIETANQQSNEPAQTKPNLDERFFNIVESDINNRIRNGNDNTRDRKLSLDHSILSRREGLSQSELDLHSMGKLPLERKSSFFRKTMDSFVRNTTEMFKKQNKSLQRRVSMSCSLQSLNEKCLTSNDSRELPIQQVNVASEDNRTELQLPSQMARSNSSLSSMVQCQSASFADSYSDSQPTLQSLPGSTPENLHSCSVHSLNEAYVKESMLNSRAISMSSGLDSTFGHLRRKSSRSNRVTWVASEGLTNYLRRVIQDEKTKEMQSCQSYQDFSCIPENEQYSRKADTKGRRLSYQRAVSGEDPVMPTRHPDSTLRRKYQIPEMCETNMEIADLLAEFTRCGLPTVQGFELARVSDEAYAWLLWACDEENFYKIIKLTKTLSVEEQERQAAIRELITSEVEHIKHMLWIMEVYIGAAHWLQEKRRMMSVNTAKLFYNIPDVLNANIYFWSEAFMPMIKDAHKNNRLFRAELMKKGFCECFAKIFSPYEKYVVEQNNILEYYRSKQDDPEFVQYVTWCQNKKKYQRLQLNDFFAKPFQRLTKYELLLDRIVQHTYTEPERTSLLLMEASVKAFVRNVNYSVRQREEIDKVDKLQHTLEPYGGDLRDEDLEGVFNKYSSINLSFPMLHCRSLQRRCIIHQENLRYRNGHKETDVRVIVMTDMLLVCKRMSKGPRSLKMIKPAYMIDKLVQTPKFDSKNSQELSGLCYVVLNELGFSSGGFVLTESSRDPQQTLRIFENKMKEAMLTYELHIKSTRNPNKEITDAEVNQMMDYLQIRARSSVEDANIMREARERVAAMVHESAAASKFDPALFSTDIASEVVVGVSARQPWPHHRTHLLHRTVTTSLPKSPYLTLPKSTSTRSHSDEEQPGPSSGRLRRTVSLECLMMTPMSGEAMPYITVQDSNGESDSLIPQQSPKLTASPNPPGWSESSQQQQMLRVHSHNNVTILQTCSPPGLIVEPYTTIATSSTTQSVSDKMYQTHNASLQKNQLEASQHYLTPDPRSTSYPPQSPTRGSLRRGLAFSFSIKTTPLTKMERLGSPLPVQMDDPQCTSQYTSPEKRGGSPKPRQSTERTEKKSKLSSGSSFFGSSGRHSKREG